MTAETRTESANPIDSLHRYFIWADRMRVHFDKTLAAQTTTLAFGSKEHIEINLYMSFWYGELFVVVEGVELTLFRQDTSSMIEERVMLTNRVEPRSSLIGDCLQP